jgi:hypothetical protein
VDSDYKILGIISQADIATRLDHPEETARVVKEISQPPIETEPFENKGHLGETEF